MLARSLLVAVVASSRAVRRLSCSEVMNKSRMPVESDGRMSVRCAPGESKMTLSFVFEGKRKQLLRNQEEPLGCALRRITQSAIAILEGRKKKKYKKKKNKSTSQELETDVVGGAAVARTSGMNEPVLSGCDVKDDAGAECETVKVHLSFAGEAMDPELINSEAWREGATLEIGSNCYQVERNPPSIISLSLPSVIMFGFPVFPVAHFEFVDRAHILYEWFVDADEVKAVEHEERTWQLVGNAEFFTPSVQHVGHRLRFRVTPGDGTRLGESQEKETTTVEASPGRCTFDSRHRFTTDKTALGTLRVISYNILADTYAQTELARTVLFPYCPPYAMDLGYRQQLLQKELKGYNGDIVCLQEVDNRVFERLTPILQRLGFEGKYCEKENQHEGLALFYQTSRLRLIDQHDVAYAEALKNESRHTPFLEHLSTHPQLLSLICDLSTVLQVCVFQSVEDESQKLCVANTHLYWHPQSAAVRLVQVVLALHHLEHVTSTMHPSTPVVFCGDFNSTPDTGLYDFITSGTFSACHDDWRRLEGENDVPAGFGIEVGHNLGMYSACGEPEYTNFVQSFNGCLDYVFASRDALQIVQILPMPSHEEITAHIALPSITHPSDHIALVCDLKFSPRDDK